MICLQLSKASTSYEGHTQFYSTYSAASKTGLWVQASLDEEQCVLVSPSSLKVRWMCCYQHAEHTDWLETPEDRYGMDVVNEGVSVTDVWARSLRANPVKVICNSCLI